MPKSHVLRFEAKQFQENILSWYAKNQRILPWRVKGRQKTDPYKVWLSEIMLQQTTVTAVIPYFLKFVERWPDVKSLAEAKDEHVMAAWAGLGYYARARNLLKCARVVQVKFKGKFPHCLDKLQSLPGIGPYTAAAILSIAFGKPATVVDGNIERIVSRLFAISTPLPLRKKEVLLKAQKIFENIDIFEKQCVKSFPQALMDIGATICTPKNPSCNICPAQNFCVASANNTAEFYPVKAVKKAIPIRIGKVYWIEDTAGKVIFEKRSDARMLGGMIGMPTTDWDLKEYENNDNEFVTLIEKKVKNLQNIGKIYHVFTHFRLELNVMRGSVSDITRLTLGRKNMISLNIKDVKIENIGFPVVFLKAFNLINKTFLKVQN